MMTLVRTICGVELESFASPKPLFRFETVDDDVSVGN